jgi:cytochrome c oxidase assembly factor CtaG
MRRLAVAGAGGFWVVNLLISLTPLAADYRAALSIPYASMLVEAAVGGLLIGVLVSWGLLRFPGRVPGRSPMTQSLTLSVIVIVAVTALVETPAKFAGPLDDPWRHFLVALGFNVLRILALGTVIGHLAKRVTAPAVT